MKEARDEEGHAAGSGMRKGEKKHLVRVGLKKMTLL